MKLYSHYIKIKNIKIKSIRTKSIKIKSIAVLAVCSLFFSVGSGAITSFAHTPDESRFLNGTGKKTIMDGGLPIRGTLTILLPPGPNIKDTPTILVPMAIWLPVGII